MKQMIKRILAIIIVAVMSNAYDQYKLRSFIKRFKRLTRQNR